jgi:hypothetical protein
MFPQKNSHSLFEALSQFTGAISRLLELSAPQTLEAEGLSMEYLELAHSGSREYPFMIFLSCLSLK